MCVGSLHQQYFTPVHWLQSMHTLASNALLGENAQSALQLSIDVCLLDSNPHACVRVSLYDARVGTQGYLVIDIKGLLTSCSAAPLSFLTAPHFTPVVQVRD